MSEQINRELPVYLEGKRCGTVKASAAGPRTVFQAECAGLPGGIVRLYLFNREDPEKRLYIGVLVPEENGFARASRTVSHTEAAEKGIDTMSLDTCGLDIGGKAVAGDRELWEDCPDPAAFFEDRALNASLHGASGALVRIAGEKRVVAIPFDDYRIFSAAPAFTLATVTRISGKRYALLAADKGGRPARVNKDIAR